MIIDKRVVIIIAVAVLLITLLIIGFSFLGKMDEDLSALEFLESDGGESEKPDFAATDYYRIVLSGDCTPEVADAARVLEAAIEKATGIDCGVTYEMQDVPARTDFIEILIGNVDSNSTAIAFEDLRAEDYVCEWVSGSLIIGGFSNSATLNAIERFCDEIMPYATAASLMSEELEFSYKHDYDIDSIKLCGFEISDYSIACTEETVDYAHILADNIAQRAGYFLDVTVGGDRDKVKEIVFSIDTRLGNSAYVEHDREDVVIKAKDAYGLSIALNNFCEELLFTDSNKVSFDLLSQKTYSYSVPEISVMGILSEIPMSDSSLVAMSDATSRIKSRRPDVVVFGKVNLGVMEMIMCGLPSGYSRVDVITAGGSSVAILYRTQSVNITLDKSTDGDISVVDMRLTHKASGEKYQMLILASVSSVSVDLLSSAIANNVSDDCDTIIMSMFPENKSDTSGLQTSDFDTKYNSSLYVRNSEHRVIALCEKNVDCNFVSSGYNETGNAVFINMVFNKIRCLDILKDIQQ